MERSTIPKLPWLAVLFVLFRGLGADEPRFRCHDLDAGSTYSACAALDVYRDGLLDVGEAGSSVRGDAVDGAAGPVLDGERDHDRGGAGEAREGLG